MLKLSGIDARPVLCSAVSNGIAAFPSQAAFNYVVVSATLDDRTILLDASDKYSSPGILPYRILDEFHARFLKFLRDIERIFQKDEVKTK